MFWNATYSNAIVQYEEIMLNLDTTTRIMAESIILWRQPYLLDGVKEFSQESSSNKQQTVHTRPVYKI